MCVCEHVYICLGMCVCVCMSFECLMSSCLIHRGECDRPVCAFPAAGQISAVI